MHLKPLLLIFLGGGTGASLRYLLSSYINLRSATTTFPWGIFSCNLGGCLAIGMVFGWLHSSHPGWVHPLLVTGLLGGFTTFSSFALESQLLIQNQAYLAAALYTIGSLTLGITLCFAGYLITS